MTNSTSFLVNRSGPALAADSLKVTGPIFLRNSKCLGNHPTRGVVRLLGADTGRDLEFNGATLSNEAGAALIATGLRVNGTVSFRDNFHAAGCHQPTLDLAAAQVGGGLDFGNSRILGQDGMALNLASASVTWICLPGNAICRSGNRDDPGSWEGDGQLQLDGFTYAALDPRGADLNRWLLWLHSRTPAYAEQPYRQLATIYRSVGDEVSARKVLIAQQDDLLARGRLGGHWARAWHRLKKVTVGYGYQSWRALVGLIVIVILAIALGLAAGHIPGISGLETGASKQRTHPLPDALAPPARSSSKSGSASTSAFLLSIPGSVIIAVSIPLPIPGRFSPLSPGSCKDWPGPWQLWSLLVIPA